MNNIFFYHSQIECEIFFKSQNLWSLAQAYPSTNHWWSIIFATLPFLERVKLILLEKELDKLSLPTDTRLLTSIFAH